MFKGEEEDRSIESACFGTLAGKAHRGFGFADAGHAFEEHDGFVLEGAFQIQGEAISADEAEVGRWGTADFCACGRLLVFQNGRA